MRSTLRLGRVFKPIRHREAHLLIPRHAAQHPSGQCTGSQLRCAASLPNHLRHHDLSDHNDPHRPHKFLFRREAAVSEGEWVQAKDRLVSMEKGTMQRSDWQEASNLLGGMVTNMSLPRSEERIKDGFALIDRLNEERMQRVDYSLDSRCLFTCLVAWRDYVVTAIESGESSHLNVEKPGLEEEGITTTGFLHTFWDYALAALPFSSTPEQLSALGGLSPAKVLEKVELYTESGLLLPDAKCTSLVLQIMAVTEGPEKVNALLEQMEREDSVRLRPDAHCYSQLLTAWRNQGNPEECEAALRRLVARWTSGALKGFPVNEVLFTITMSAWLDSTNPQQAREKIESLYQLMLQVGLKPQITTFRMLVAASARTDSEHGMRRIGELLREAALHGIKLDGVTYHSVIHRLSQSSRSESLDEAFAYLQEMKRVGLTPTKEIYNTMMTACRRKAKFDLVEDLFTEYGAPDEILLKTLLLARATAGKPEQAAETLRELTRLWKQGLAKTPSVVEFNLVLQAWRFSKRKDAVERVLEGLRQMQKYANIYDCAPNDKTFDIVVGVLVDSVTTKDIPHGQAAMMRAHSIIEEMQEINMTPTVRTYRSMVIGWAKLQNPSKADKWYQGLERHYKSDLYALGARLSAWSKLGNPEMAMAALDGMIRAHDNGEIEKHEPSTRRFVSVLYAWVLSDRMDAGERAEELLRRMFELAERKKLDCMPDFKSFGLVISAHRAAKSPDLGKRCLALLAELKQLCKTNPGNRFQDDLLTYCALIQALCVDGSDEAEDALLRLIQEMVAKPFAFWNAHGDKERGRKIGMAIHHIRGTSFRSQDKMIALLDHQK